MDHKTGPKVLTLNCGGSSIKYKLFAIETESVIAEGSVQGLGGSRSLFTYKVQGMQPVTQERAISGHQEGLRLVIGHFNHLKEQGLINPADGFIVAHKIAHGGNRVGPVEWIDHEVEEAITEMSVVTSVHNPPMLSGIRAIRAIDPNLPQIAVFETGFHHSIPSYATVYGLPLEWSAQFGLRKYGFHGASHQYISAKVPQILNRPAASLKLISIHLGSGTSVAALSGGRSLDVSSGFTPQSGTIMSTRAGDFDPEILFFLLARKILSLEELREILNNQAGLAGISGIAGGDIRDIQKAADDGNERAQLAMAAFCYSIKKFIGAFAAVLQGVDAISFTGGIGENNPRIRSTICNGMEWLGIKLDEAKNSSALGKGIISRVDSPVQLVVLPTDEELVVAKQAFEFWKNQNGYPF
ncbi:MAG TPA: acetate kinase [Firmicutes bacterium]|jgi:acetate kinase|nr:acetate kinase [Bacillota bacterium]